MFLSALLALEGVTSRRRETMSTPEKAFVSNPEETTLSGSFISSAGITVTILAFVVLLFLDTQIVRSKKL